MNASRLITAIPLVISVFMAPFIYAQSDTQNYPETTNNKLNDNIQLPELGDSASGLFSLEKEYQIGRHWLRIFRSQVLTVSDPLLQDYIEDMTYRLATYSGLKDRRLDIVIVNNRAINAFAVPGGVIGVHNGLLLQAETEAQMASVLSHELAHLSQRHFARSQEAKKRNAIPNMAGLLAGIILAATEGGGAGLAAIRATQAASLQNQLRYSRLHEQEADRAGMQTMSRANMDPSAAADMFEVMLRTFRYAGNRPPEFLLSHPITENRVSDARNRSRQYTRKIYTDNTDFQLMRARVEFGFIENSKDAIKRFRAKVTGDNHYPDANEYGLILSLTANGDFKEAQQRLDVLLKAAPNKMSYVIAQAEIDLAAGRYQQAINLLNKELSLAPGNHPLTMTLAKALLKANQPHQAEAVLIEHSARKPNNPYVWYLLAETHGLAGNIVGVHHARAEYFVLNGILDKAVEQLGYALPLVDNDHLNSARINERIEQIKEMKNQIEQL